MATDDDARMKSEAVRLGLGATGRYPQGKVSAHDQGELVAAMTVRDGKVIVNFGKAVAWLAMTPDEAFCLGHALALKAAQARGG